MSATANFRYVAAALVLLSGCVMLLSADDTVGKVAGVGMALAGVGLMWVNWRAPRTK